MDPVPALEGLRVMGDSSGEGLSRIHFFATKEAKHKGEMPITHDPSCSQNLRKKNMRICSRSVGVCFLISLTNLAPLLTDFQVGVFSLGVSYATVTFWEMLRGEERKTFSDLRSQRPSKDRIQDLPCLEIHLKILWILTDKWPQGLKTGFETVEI